MSWLGVYPYAVQLTCWAAEPPTTLWQALVALGDVPPWWAAGEQRRQEAAAAAAAGSDDQHQQQEAEVQIDPYPMDYYAKDGGPWNSSYHRKPPSRAAGGAAAAAAAARARSVSRAQAAPAAPARA